MNVIIADDEPLARENLRLLIYSHLPDLSVVAECSNSQEVLLALTKNKVDLILLDIEMPGQSGIDLAFELMHLNIKIIFVTAHDEYAIRAFRVSAVDYLLKPVDSHLLCEAIEKCIHKSENISRSQLDIIQSHQKDKFEQIALPTRDGLEICKLSDILYLIGDESYTHVHTSSNRSLMISRKLGEMEEILAGQGFVRIHKTNIINLSHVKRYFKGEGGSVEMIDGKVLNVSRMKKDELLNLLNRV
ncbi:MAG: LytTR family DNA-binding domain-containing protein [Chitinophagales bacterium]|nr:LytTR family DNA-binding domain-containing protein [Chitinophagales bacterium]